MSPWGQHTVSNPLHCQQLHQNISWVTRLSTLSSDCQHRLWVTGHINYSSDSSPGMGSVQFLPWSPPPSGKSATWNPVTVSPDIHARFRCQTATFIQWITDWSISQTLSSITKEVGHRNTIPSGQIPEHSDGTCSHACHKKGCLCIHAHVCVRVCVYVPIHVCVCACVCVKCTLYTQACAVGMRVLTYIHVHVLWCSNGVLEKFHFLCTHKYHHSQPSTGWKSVHNHYFSVICQSGHAKQV